MQSRWSKKITDLGIQEASLSVKIKQAIGTARELETAIEQSDAELNSGIDGEDRQKVEQYRKECMDAYNELDADLEQKIQKWHDNADVRARNLENLKKAQDIRRGSGKKAATPPPAGQTETPETPLPATPPAPAEPVAASPAADTGEQQEPAPAQPAAQEYNDDTNIPPAPAEKRNGGGLGMALAAGILALCTFGIIKGFGNNN